jgi:hypothetical protein
MLSRYYSLAFHNFHCTISITVCTLHHVCGNNSP